MKQNLYGKKYKEIKNDVIVSVGLIDDNCIKDTFTINLKINYDGYFKITEKELELLSIE